VVGGQVTRSRDGSTLDARVSRPLGVWRVACRRPAAQGSHSRHWRTVVDTITTPGSAFLATMVVAAAIEIALPLLPAVLARRRYGVGWRYFLIGALVFFVAQILLRLPAMHVIQLLIAAELRSAPSLVWGWLVVAAVTAGIFEEVGRYLGFRIFLRHEPKTWAKGVMVGLGHRGAGRRRDGAIAA
jgi:membrane protease YdiL (CAAX protease family)